MLQRSDMGSLVDLEREVLNGSEDPVVLTQYESAARRIGRRKFAFLGLFNERPDFRGVYRGFYTETNYTNPHLGTQHFTDLESFRTWIKAQLDPTPTMRFREENGWYCYDVQYPGWVAMWDLSDFAQLEGWDEIKLRSVADCVLLDFSDAERAIPFTEPRRPLVPEPAPAPSAVSGDELPQQFVGEPETDLFFFNGVRLSRGEDYRIDYATGRITWLAGFPLMPTDDLAIIGYGPNGEQYQASFVPRMPMLEGVDWAEPVDHVFTTPMLVDVRMDEPPTNAPNCEARASSETLEIDLMGLDQRFLFMGERDARHNGVYRLSPIYGDTGQARELGNTGYVELIRENLNYKEGLCMLSHHDDQAYVVTEPSTYLPNMSEIRFRRMTGAAG